MISSSIDPRGQLLNLLSCQNFDLSMGYRQVKSEPTMFVVLSYSWLIPREYTITSFGLTNAITVFTWWWKSSDMEIPMSCCWAHQQHFVSPMIHVEHQPSVGNFISIIFVFRSWSICRMKEVTYSNSCALDASCRREFEKVCFASSGIIPIQSCICAKYTVVWRLATFILYVSLAHQATNWLV